MIKPHPFKASRILGALFARYIVDSATMELLLSGAFAAMVGDRNGQMTHTVFHHTKMLSEKIDLIKDLAKSLSDDHPVKEPMLKLIPDIKTCAALRNKLCHGSLAWTEHGNPAIAAWLISKRRKTELYPLTIGNLKTEVNLLRSVIFRMRELGLAEFAETVIGVKHGTLPETDQSKLDDTPSYN